MFGCVCVGGGGVQSVCACVGGSGLKYHMSLNNSKVERKLPGSCFSHMQPHQHTNHLAILNANPHLHPSMGTKIEVKLVRMSDAYVDRRPSGDVPTTTNLDKENRTENIVSLFSFTINLNNRPGKHIISE